VPGLKNVTARLLVTGSSGLVGSEAVRHFCALGHRVHGFDSHMRKDFFGAAADSRPTLERLREDCPSFVHHELDVRDRARVREAVAAILPQAVIHCAAQPSHELSARRPLDDFDVNAVGTLNLLDALRTQAPEAPFVLLSSNKVYGDAPNELPLRELPTRFDYARAEHAAGIDESTRIDRSLHTPMGVSKLAADLLTQEYGRSFGMPTCVLRGSCLTGAAHQGAELHGFLSYLAKCVVAGIPYTIHGHAGKQVRDNLHARDVVAAIAAVIASPRPGEVYNLGGGRSRSISLLEAITALEARAGRKLRHTYSERARSGDHVCYITDVRKLERDYPSFRIARSLDEILDELVEHEQEAAWARREARP
jgi:CDP-paratose 2-epimerase